MKSMDTTNTVTNEDIARFVTGDGAKETGENNATLAFRVLQAALVRPDVQEKLMLSRGIEADWQAGQATREAEPDADEAACLTVLQNALRRVTQKVAGFSDTNDFSQAAVLEASQLREAGGGRWITQTAQSLREALEVALRAARNVQTLTLGRAHPVRLPCFAPALAAPAALSVVLAPRRSETIMADGVKIEFQQLPGSGNRVRVFVDTTLLPTPHAALHESPAFGTSASFNVAFLTLIEGEGDEPAASEEAGTNRHVLVVSLNERGVGFADFMVASGGISIEAGGKNVLPAPRTGGCSLVSATLSYLPRLPAG